MGAGQAGIRIVIFSTLLIIRMFSVPKEIHESIDESKISKFCLVDVISPRCDNFTNYTLLSLSRCQVTTLCQIIVNKKLRELKISIKPTVQSSITLSVLLSGDIHVNPGPVRKAKYPCTVSERVCDQN